MPVDNPILKGKELQNMTKNHTFLIVSAMFVAALLFACTGGPTEKTTLKRFPIADLDNVLDATVVTLDEQISSDANGSLKAVVAESTVVHLFEVAGLNVENTQLSYRAMLRTEELQGQCLLEMWCHFPGKGEYFSRSVQSPLSGTTDWTQVETPFFLREGENPDTVKLNVVVTGSGTVWIDDVILLKSPLK